MNSKRMCVAVFAAVVVLAPSVVFGQMDPAANQGPQGMNQPANQPGSTAPTGTQTIPNNSMPDSLGAPGMTGQQMLDKQFVRAAFAAGLADVKLGSLAVEKGGPEVKELAQKMVDDHTVMNKEMDSVADALGVMLPKNMNHDGQKEYEKLSGLSGKDFDTEYVTFIAKAHYADLHAFHSEASVATDPDLASEVVKGLGMMHQHLGLIANVAKEQGIALPPRPPRPAPATVSK